MLRALRPTLPTFPRYPPTPTHPSLPCPAAAAAKSAGKTSQGGSVWPHGQPATTKAGRLVFNTNIHGTVFNTAAGRGLLTQFMQLLRTDTAAVFRRRTFGRMALEPGYGLRLVSTPAFPCACESESEPGWAARAASGVSTNQPCRLCRLDFTKRHKVVGLRGLSDSSATCAVLGAWQCCPAPPNASSRFASHPSGRSCAGARVDAGPGLWPQLCHRCRLGRCQRHLGPLALHRHPCQRCRTHCGGWQPSGVVVQPGAWHQL